MSWKDVPIPPLMKGLMKDERGFPIPYVVLMDKNNKPLFKINDEQKKVSNCIERRLCSVCGNPMLQGKMWMIGGMKSAYHPQGAFNDTPVHKECGEYALQVCPYLAYTQYSRKPIDFGKVVEATDEKIQGFVDMTQSEERLDFFCFLRVTDFKVKRYSIAERYIYPIKPYLEERYWLDGKEITMLDAEAILQSKGKESLLPLNKTI